ncbi:hypothetical protein ANCCEY_11072, partial [Ancylostoma ceylanicum]
PLRYVGPLTVLVQELDGSFSHTVQIDGDISRADLQCHSKGRRQKKMRKAALHIIVERLSMSRKKQSTNDLMRLLTMLAQDTDPAIRLHIATLLATMPPFSAHE